MPKGYLFARMTITDPEAYAAYIKASISALAVHGGKAIIRGGAQTTLEGDCPERHVLIEFPNYADAIAYYQSSEYQSARALRSDAAIADIVALEGAV